MAAAARGAPRRSRRSPEPTGPARTGIPRARGGPEDRAGRASRPRAPAPTRAGGP